jgi:cytochrome c556
MKSLLKIAIPAALLAATATTAIADGHIDKAIKARKAQMQLYAFNLGQLGAMAKGEAEYKAEQAASLAGNMQALVNLDASSMWAPGSDSTAHPEMTRAKAEIWSTYPAVVDKQKALVTATAALLEVAGNGQAALGGGLKDVGAACGACHKQFRDEKK